MLYTVEVYKLDGRVKKGKRLIQKIDLDCPVADPKEAERMAWAKICDAEGHALAQKYEYVVHETYVTRVNVRFGNSFQERYDTPYSCSPSSETYWCS